MRAIAVLLLGWLPLAAAAQATGTLDLYYVPSAELEIDGLGSTLQLEGDGFGIKGRVLIAPRSFLAGEYQVDRYDDAEGTALADEVELRTFRAGVGLQNAGGFYSYGEYVNLELKGGGSGEDESGWGTHIGFAPPVGQLVGITAQAGWLDVGDAGSGIEFLLGLSFRIGPGLGLFADYRQTSLEDDAGGEGENRDVRAGFRFEFG